MWCLFKMARSKDELPKDLLEIICCPVDKADLVYNKKAQTLTCTKCKFIYPIKDGIPILLPPEMQSKEIIMRSKKNGWKGQH